LRLTVRTGTYIPLAPALLNMLNCSEFKRKPKPSTQLKNLDFEYAIRAPKAYMRTRTYADNLADELAFALIEVFEAQSKSIAFPEMVIPALITLKRCIKSSSSPRLISALKPVVEKLDANRTYIEAKRAKVEFTPADRSQVDGFLRDDDEETPLAAMLRRERKLRAKRRELMEKNADDDELMD
jgi:nucleolar complex protein 2